jgi:hypothetical protein
MSRSNFVAKRLALAAVSLCVLVPTTVAGDCPELAGSVDLLGTDFDVAVSGGYAYVLDDISLAAIDVSAPSAPVEVEVVIIPDTGQCVAVSGGYA